MRLVVFGLTVSSSWGNGHATLWRGLVRALIARGHQMAFFERDVPYYAGHRDLLALPEGGSLILCPRWEDALPLARRHLAGAEVALVTSCCPDGLAATDLVLSSPAGLKVLYDLDTPITLARLDAGDPVSYIGPALRLPAWRFLIGGTLYPHDFPWADNIFFVRHIPPPERPAFYCSSPLTLNVTRQAMAQMGYCPSGRLFEAAACGAALLSDDWEGLDRFFAPGSEIQTIHLERGTGENREHRDTAALSGFPGNFCSEIR